jgi:aminoglycoside phosphotransferase (APT) family kinase protein
MLPRWLSLNPVVPPSWDDVTPGWMTQAIARDHPDAVVMAVRIVTRDDGTNRRVRFALDYARGSGPATIFIKAHQAAHRWVHLRNGNLFGEARLFASGADLPVEHPHVYCAIPDYLRLDFLLVMEDLNARGADPRDATRPMSVDQVADGLKGLASLHSQNWNRIDPRLKWVKQWKPTQGWQVGLRKRTPMGLERGRDVLSPELADITGDAIVDHWVQFVSSLRTGPQSLLHGDAHIGNTYILPDDKVGFLDWQVVRRGHWSQDVGYFLVGALTLEDRRAHDRDLLRHYFDALSEPDKGSFDEAWQRYRMSHAYGLAIWLSTLGTDGWQAHDISRALVSRYAAAFVEHDTRGALKEAGF